MIWSVFMERTIFWKKFRSIFLVSGGILQELSCPTERQDGITTIEINLHSAQEDITEYDFGYLVMGEYVFDLELDGERAVCAAASEYAADSAFDSARVELFVKQGDED